MPTFFPPLGHHTQATFAPPPDSPSNPFLQLNFIAELGPDEQHLPSGERFELWTDVDEVKDREGGEGGAREWHAVAYELVSATATNDAQGAYRYARILVRAQPQSFAYTLRLVKADGQVIWLGNGGDNGFVEVKEAGDVVGGVAESGPWEGHVARPGDEGVEWTGVAVDMSTKSVTRLPFPSPLRTQIVIVRSDRPRPYVPFCTASSGDHADTERIKTEYIAIASRSPDIDLPQGVLPSSSKTASFGRDTILAQAISKLAIHSSMGARDSRKDVGAAIITPEQVQAGFFTGSHATWLLVNDAPAPVPITLPPLTEPVLVQLGDKAYASHLDPEPVLDIGAGLTATFLSMTPFAQLRGTGNDVIWLCTPQGKATEEGEEEIEDDKAPVVHLPASPAQEARQSTSHNHDESKPTVDNGSRTANEDHDEHDDVDEPDESSFRTAPENHDVNKTPKTGLFALLGRILNRVFAWIFWPFGYGSTKAVSNNKDVSDTGDARDAPETPAEGGRQIDERTPLLSTPGLSRSTSESVFSALASPESFETIKPNKLHGADTDKHDGKAGMNVNGYSTPIASTSTSGLGLALSSPVASPTKYDPRTSAPHATVRSYIRFSLGSLDSVEGDMKAATFWACKDTKEGGGGIKADELAFAARKMGEREWRDVDVEWEEQGEGLSRAAVILNRVKEERNEGKEQGVEGEWQVQVTRA